MVSSRFRSASLVAAALLSLTAIAAACSSSQPDREPAGETPASDLGQRVEAEGGFYTDVSPQELRSMLEDEDFPLVNVHIPYEGEIEATDLFIPYDQIQDRLAELPSNEAKIVLYCRSGSMSATAAKALVELGYTNVWNLDGGMIAWEGAGYRLLSGG